MLNNVNEYNEAVFADLADKSYQQDPVTYDWGDLADTWANSPNFEGHDVMYDAIHKVMWGFAPKKGYSGSYLQYIDAVADVMENCDEAVETWRTMLDFVNARDYLAATMEPEVDDGTDYCYTIIHYHYLCDRMMCNEAKDPRKGKFRNNFWSTHGAMAKEP